ncbi:MAG: YtxH domain-containing protein [Acidobacteria bacterium]|nr:YtxH domain-containing protein [Acidobacteriota bacterium]
MSEASRMCLGATIGALCGAAVAYLFFTDRGRELRDRIEPAVDDLRREFGRFQKTIEKVGDLASDGMRVMEEFRAARAQSDFPTGTMSH